MELYIADPTTGSVVEIPFKSFTESEELNVAKTLQVALDYGAVDAVAAQYGQTAFFMLSAGYREIYAEKDGIRFYSGIINEIGLDRGEGEDISVSLASTGFFSLLTKRRTAELVTYSGDDSGDIAWGLIDTSQTVDGNADLGITRGLHPTTVDRDRTFRFAKVSDEIVGMSNTKIANGFDFEVDDDKVFNIYYPYKGSQRPELVLDIANIKAISMRKPMILNMTNRITVLGQADDNFVVRESPATFREVFGNLEDLLAKRDVVQQSTLEDYGDKLLSTDQNPQLAFTVTTDDGAPDILDYNVGDWLPLSFSEAQLTSVMYRVIKRTIQHTAGGATKVTNSMRLQ